MTTGHHKHMLFVQESPIDSLVSGGQDRSGIKTILSWFFSSLKGKAEAVCYRLFLLLFPIYSLSAQTMTEGKSTICLKSVSNTGTVWQVQVFFWPSKGEKPECKLLVAAQWCRQTNCFLYAFSYSFEKKLNAKSQHILVTVYFFFFFLL